MSTVTTIPFYQTWDTPPNLALLSSLPKPTIKPLREDVIVEYDEATLKAMAITSQNKFLGFTITEDSLNGLPDGLILELYMNIRYGIPPDTYIPLRSGVAGQYNGALTTIGAYIVVSAIFSHIYEQNTNKLLPQHVMAVRIARDYLSICNYQIWTIGKQLDNWQLPAGTIVVGDYTLLTTSGENSEQERHIFLDEVNLQTYIDAGNTQQDAVDHWVANETQPS